MPSLSSNFPKNFSQHLADARAGSAEELGRLLMDCRNYLLLTARQKLEPDLQGKLSPSDLVQETFLEAQRDFHQFDVNRKDEWLAWLCRILFNNLANASRSYRATDKRALGREIPLGELGAQNGLASELILNTPTPSERAAASEEAAALEQALASLPDHYQQVLRLRYQDQRTFADIGTTLNCSAEAARKLWARAVDQLQKKLGHPA
jgi:RNA polymerase sigma-70 factor (ECF subfamily)